VSVTRRRTLGTAVPLRRTLGVAVSVTPRHTLGTAVSLRRTLGVAVAVTPRHTHGTAVSLRRTHGAAVSVTPADRARDGCRRWRRACLARSSAACCLWPDSTPRVSEGARSRSRRP
jgi:hypothetical protein